MKNINGYGTIKKIKRFTAAAIRVYDLCEMSSRNYDSDWGEILGTPTSSYFRFRQNGYSDGTYCWLIGL